MNVLYNLNIITYVDKILRLQSLIMYLILQTIQIDIHSSQSCTNCFFKMKSLEKNGWKNLQTWNDIPS